jgi:hypothetical protein
LRELDEESCALNGVFVPEFSVGRGKQRSQGDERKGRDAMREMKIAEASGRRKTPLVVRASLPRVFLGLGVFMEASLLFCGSYLLANVICNRWMPERFPWLAEECSWRWRRCCFFTWPGRAREDPFRSERSQRNGAQKPH